jgi:glutathione synthase
MVICRQEAGNAETCFPMNSRPKSLWILDPLEKLRIETDTSILLMNEALRQGWAVCSVPDFDIFRDNRGLRGPARRHERPITPAILGEPEITEDLDLESFDLVVIRKDPPFDETYLALLLLLSGLRRPLVVNRPGTLLRRNEKLSIFLFPEYITSTLVTSSPARIREFVRAEGGTAVLKPLFSCSGRGVHLLRSGGDDPAEVIAEATGGGVRPVMIQRYLAGVTAGETRVFLLEDRILSAIRKVPAPGSFKANFDSGARGEPHRLTPREREICFRVGNFCLREGIYLSALDLIDGCLSEFNITSPGLLVESNRVNRTAAQTEVIKLLADRAARRSPRP